jgi:hypothetical protein
MATQNCPGILQVEMKYRADGQDIENVYHVSNDTLSIWPVGEIQDVIQVFYDTLWTASQRAMLCPATSLISIVATDLTNLLGKKIVRSISPAEAGTNASTNLPNNATFAVNLQPDERGRGVAGRVFWPTIPRGGVVLDTVDTTYAADAIAALEATMVAIGLLTGAPQLVILSRFLNGAKRALGVARVVQSVSVRDLTVDSMKLRLPGHKRHKKQPA